MSHFSSVLLALNVLLATLVVGSPITVDNDPAVIRGIKKIAAIGDSYSAGIGSGKNLATPGNEHCYRCDQAYPYLIHQDYRLGGPDSPQFDYVSCSGATAPEIKKQAEDDLPKDTQYDVILVSAGGNDLGFSKIVMDCIYVGWGDCAQAQEDAVANLKKTGEGSFDAHIRDLLDAVKLRLNDKGTAYWTGYATFFDNTTTACDEVNIGVIGKWPKGPDPELLTQKFRNKINGLVRAANAKLGGIITAYNKELKKKGDKEIIWVDYEDVTSAALGKLCGPGTDETQEVSPDSPHEYWQQPWDSMFFQYIFGERPRQELHRGEQGGGAEVAVARAEAPTTDMDLKDVALKLLGQQLYKWAQDADVPFDHVLKWFHPKPIAHTIIANYVLNKMAQRQAKGHGSSFPDMLVTLDLKTCPIKDKPTDQPVQPKHSCYDQSKHKPTSEKDASEVAKTCASIKQTRMDSGSEPIFLRAKNRPGFTGTISWVRNCPGESQNVLKPAKDVTCENLIYDSWKKCNNGGAGGSVNIGCLRYDFTPEPYTPSELGSLHCLERSDHKPVLPSTANGLIDMGSQAAGTLPQSVGPDTKVTVFDQSRYPEVPPGLYGMVYWVPGCYGDALNTFAPNPDDDRTWKPERWFSENWIDCRNDGSGGYRDVGCVRYVTIPCDHGRPVVGDDGKPRCSKP